MIVRFEGERGRGNYPGYEEENQCGCCLECGSTLESGGDVITGAFRRGVVSLTFVLRLQWLRRGNWKLFMDVFIDRLMVNIEKRGEKSIEWREVKINS